MEKNIPKIGLILNYKNIFEREAPTDRLLHLKKNGISKIEVISRLCLINSILSPRLSVRFDYSINTQHKILDKILSLDKNQLAIQIIKKKIDEKSLIFNRPSNLFALMEILNSDLRYGDKNDSVSNVQELDFFEYYLCVNHETNQLNKDLDSENPDVETLNASFIAHNEYFENIDPIHTIYRGKRLFEYLEKDSTYGNLFKEYILKISGKNLKEYLLEILSIFLAADNEKEEFNFYYKLNNELVIFNSFSERNIPIEIGNQIEALNIRKSPLYKVDETSYMLMDNKLLMEKCYNLIIWEFLFEKILISIPKEKRGGVISNYKSVIGYFFEDYIREKIENSLPFLKNPKPKLFDDLKIGGREIGDVYIRQNKKILLGEVKSSGIPSKSKYGENLSEFYGNDRANFFKIHGLNQLITNLNNLLDNPSEYDEKLNFTKKHIIFPVIITNEVALTLGFTIHIFNKEFNSRFDKSKYPLHDIRPVMILHISDIEFLEEYLKDKSIKLFEFLNVHLNKYKFIPKLSMSYDNLRPRYNKRIGKLIFSKED